MKSVAISAGLLCAFALCACEKKEVVAVPVPVPAPATVAVPVPGPPGPQGVPGKDGSTTVNVNPAASAASN